MRINVTNKQVAWLVGDADLSNGCSVIRWVLWRSIWALILGSLLASVSLAFLLGLVTAAIMMFATPVLIPNDKGEMVESVLATVMQYIPYEWMAHVGILAWVILTVALALCAFGAVMAAIVVVIDKGYLKKLIPDQVAETVSTAGSCLHAKMERFCPQVEVITHPSLKAFTIGTYIQIKNGPPRCIDWVEIAPRYDRFYIRHVDPQMGFEDSIVLSLKTGEDDWGQAITVYTPSDEELAEWAAAREENGVDW